MIALAAMIAAVSFAVLAGAIVLLVVRFSSLLHDARHVIGKSDALLARANEAVDRARDQLEQTEAVAASMGELGSGMSELAGQVQTVASLGTVLSRALPRNGLAGKAAAFVHGVRYAVGRRLGTSRVTVPGSADNSKELAG
jgi:methyl-accepting chemotaxis protein